jgi:methanogenic corrinoid protein MtbC1
MDEKLLSLLDLKDVIAELKKQGTRDGLKVMVGGYPPARSLRMKWVRTRGGRL